MSLVVKVFLKEDIRRFSVPKNITFEELSGLLHKVFDVVTEEFKIEYQDDENDWIVASTDMELEEAKLTVSQKNQNILRLRLNSRTQKSVAENSQEPMAELIRQICTSFPAVNGYLPAMTQFLSQFKDKEHCCDTQQCKPVKHYYVQCNGCSAFPIEGTRYKCEMCDDFDFCSNCYGKVQHDASHSFTTIARPMKKRWLKKCKTEEKLEPKKNVNPVVTTTTTSTSTNDFNPASVVTDSVPKLNAQFLEDITIVDQTEVQPELMFGKIWKMKNSGSVAWPEGTRLAFVGGDSLGGPIKEGVVVPSVPADDEVEIAVDLQAPAKGGRYIGHWHLIDATGNPFGHRVWVDIVVPTVAQPKKIIPTEVLKPIPTEVLKPIPTEVLKPIPTEVLKPIPIEILKPIPTEVLKPIVDDIDDFVQVEKSPQTDKVKLADPKPIEKPVEKSMDVKPVEPRQIDRKLTDSIETKPTETKPTETKPTETKPTETKPTETKPIENPVEPKPVEGAKFSWPELLMKLSEMGFKDVKKNINLLKKHRGDLEKVVAELTS